MEIPQQLIDDLTSEDEGKQSKAVSRLKAMGADAITPLWILWVKEKGRSDVTLGLIILFVFMGLPFLLTGLLNGGLANLFAMESIKGSHWVLGSVFVLSVLLLYPIWNKHSQQKREQRYRLVLAVERYFREIDDVNCIPVLIDRLFWKPKNSSHYVLSDIVVSCLPNLLQRMPSSMIKELVQQQWVNLNRTILIDNSLKYPELVIIALITIEKGKYIPAMLQVRKLTEMTASSANQQRIQQIAHETLEKLEIAAIKLRHSERLLRPSMAPKSPSEILLRPAHGAGQADAQQLLRPSSSEEAEGEV